MLARSTEGMTQATPDASEAPARSEVDEYVPADCRTGARLFYPGPRMQMRTAIAAGGRLYVLKDLFVIDLDVSEEGHVFATHRSLPVDGVGDDESEALAAFCETFDFQWRNLVDVDEDSLTKGGLKRRRALEAIVQSVEQA